jgi:DNA polymerase-3 subunit delta'
MTEKPNNQEPAPPHFFRDILGQERVQYYLKTAWRRGRLAHAYLFLGPDGVGKASVARALAAVLNCTNLLPEDDACGECPSCRRFKAGTHPDFLVLAPEEGKNQIKIEYVREFRKLLAYPPLGGGWRVTLIKPAEGLTAQSDAAANALLKTLEEPPARNLLILAAAVEGDLLPTVVSRCQKLAFSPLPEALIAQELECRRNFEPDRAALLAALCGGSLGQALAMDPEEMLNQRRQALADLEQLGQGSVSAILDWARRLAKVRPDKSHPELDHFLALAQLWYRDLLLHHFKAPARMLAHGDLREDLEKAAAASGPNAWFARCAALAAAHRHLQANLNLELTLDILGLRLQQEKLPL